MRVFNRGPVLVSALSFGLLAFAVAAAPYAWKRAFGRSPELRRRFTVELQRGGTRLIHTYRLE